MKYIEEKFLLKLYRELYKEKAVVHSGDKGDNKFEMVRKYLDRLESTEKVYDRDKESALNYLKNRYYDKYVIKEQNIRDDSSKNLIIVKQKKSLSDCLDYLLGDENARKFPIWVRYWAFQGIVKMGTYNGATNSYSYRNDKTTTSFLILNELNKLSLNETMQMMVDYLGGSSFVNDDELKKLVENGKFSNLFAYNRWKNIGFFNQKSNVNISDGIWKKYAKNSDVSELQEVVNKHVTHWCIEDPVVMANYNSENDLEVYYVKDEAGNYSIPKLAIVINDGVVKEIRGVADFHENIDGDLALVVEEKLNTLNHGVEFDEKLNNVIFLNVIYNKHINGITLNKDELRFLYEFDKKIHTFGRSDFPDSRISLIKKERDKRSDYAVIFDCERKQVGVCMDDFLDADNNLEVYIGNIELEVERLPQFSCPKIIFGNLECPYVVSVPGFERLEIIEGNLVCPFLENPDGFCNLREVHGNAYFGKLDYKLDNLLVTGKINYSNETISDYSDGGVSR